MNKKGFKTYIYLDKAFIQGQVVADRILPSLKKNKKYY
jgi:hypothetical protein